MPSSTARGSKWPAPRFSQVPDLQALIRLPHDEMSAVPGVPRDHPANGLDDVVHQRVRLEDPIKALGTHQVPIQVDERRQVDLGAVYNSSPIGEMQSVAGALIFVF